MTGNQESISTFHSINGETIKEKWKNFNAYLQTLKLTMTDKNDLANFVQSISAKTPLEEILEIMMKFKINDMLLYELKTCNRLFIRKLLKNWRLFGEMFSKINAQQLINNILPYLSYSVKLQVLNGIGKIRNHEILLDEYFMVLEGKYGLKAATLILPGCSIDLIRATVKNYYLKLSQAQLRNILKKDKEFLEFYFEVMQDKHENNNFIKNYINIVKYIAIADSNIYWRLHEKYHLKIKFGKHMTPNIIKSYKNITQDSYAALEIFHPMQMLKVLKAHKKLETFAKSLYPETHDKFMETSVADTILKLVRREPTIRQYDLITSVFKEKYSKELLEYPNYFNENLLKITPMEERKTILDVKVKEDEKFYYLYEPAVSVPVFKKYIQHSSDSNTRNQYARYLYKTCEVNKDESALLEVLRYCMTRHKNDINFLNTFFTDAMCWPNVLDLSDEHWQYMSDINRILEISAPTYFMSSVYIEKYICYLIKNNRSIYDVIKDQVQEIVDDKRLLFLHINKEDCRSIYYDQLAICIDTYRYHAKYELLCVRFLSSLCFQFKRKSLPLLEYKRFFNQLNASDWDCWGIIKIGVTYDEETMHDLFWRTTDIMDNKLLLWYAKHRPDKLRQYTSQLFHLLEVNTLERFLLQLRKLCSPDIIENIKNLALDKYHNEDCDSAKTSIRIISILAPEVFLDVITPLLPSGDGKIYYRSNTEIVPLQKTIAESLSNIQYTLETFPLILRFCIGDYLKFGLSSLYSITYNTPELRITDCLNKIANAAVSVRKHVLNLGRHLFTIEEFYEILEEWSHKEKNLSMRNILMKKTMEFFSDSPSERIWSLLKSNLNTVDPEDREMYDFLLKLDKIPRNYLSKYLETIYKALSENPDRKINVKKFELLNTIPTVIIKQLDDKFLEEVIKESVCKELTTNFHWKCVFYVPVERQMRLLEENFQNLLCYKQENSDLMQNVQKRSNIKNFVSNFLNLVNELKHGHGLIKEFMRTWASIFQTNEFKREYMLLQFTDLYFQSGFSAYETGININKLLYLYINNYDSSIVTSFHQRLNTFLQMVSIQEERGLFEFVEGLFQDKKDHNIFIVVTHFLPKTLPTTDNAYAKYVPTLEAIKKFDLPIIQYHLDNYMSNLGD